MPQNVFLRRFDLVPIRKPRSARDADPAETLDRRSPFGLSDRLLALPAWFSLLCILGCSRAEPPSPLADRGHAVERTEAGGISGFPALPPPRQLEPGIIVHEVSLDRGTDDFWIYLPELAEGEKERKADSLPCILIAPAGSYGFLGMDLSEGDRPEHLPYVRAGFAVVAYALDGHVDPQKASDSQVVQAARSHVAAEGGLKNARAALDYIQAKVPAIDENRIFAAGHSSAATIALCITAREPRLKGCVAYAPGWTDLNRQLHPETVKLLTDQIPDYGAFLQRSSPLTYVPDLNVPVFVFHASDDSMIPIRQTSEFVAVLRRSNVNVTYVEAAHGDHYDSMLYEGIPQAIEWLKPLTMLTQ